MGRMEKKVIFVVRRSLTTKINKSEACCMTIGYHLPQSWDASPYLPSGKP